MRRGEQFLSMWIGVAGLLISVGTNWIEVKDVWTSRIITIVSLGLAGLFVRLIVSGAVNRAEVIVGRRYLARVRSAFSVGLSRVLGDIRQDFYWKPGFVGDHAETLDTAVEDFLGDLARGEQVIGIGIENMNPSMEEMRSLGSQIRESVVALLQQDRTHAGMEEIEELREVVEQRLLESIKVLE